MPGLSYPPFAQEIASGAVHRVLRDYEPADLPISAVYPPCLGAARPVSAPLALSQRRNFAATLASNLSLLMTKRSCRP